NARLGGVETFPQKRRPDGMDTFAQHRVPWRNGNVSAETRGLAEWKRFRRNARREFRAVSSARRRCPDRPTAPRFRRNASPDEMETFPRKRAAWRNGNVSAETRAASSAP